MSITTIKKLTSTPFIVDIPTSQWNGENGNFYITVNASNITANSILVPSYDYNSADLFAGTKLWCEPANGSFTINVDVKPAGTVTILVQFMGVVGEANYQVLSDVYSKSQTYSKSEVYTKTETNSAIQQSTANIKIINHGTVNLGQVAPKTRGAVTVTFATPFSDTNYSVVATFASGSQGFAYTIPQIQSKTTTTVSIGVWNNDASATATVSALDWVAVGT